VDFDMGASKVPLYAYVDETGNTGHNLFDAVQPNFYTAALITKGDFDLAFAARTKAIAQRLGTQSLHGKELGLGKLESAAADILHLLYAAKANFFVSRVEKKIFARHQGLRLAVRFRRERVRGLASLQSAAAQDHASFQDGVHP
jgi:hypothetical protein